MLAPASAAALDVDGLGRLVLAEGETVAIHRAAELTNLPQHTLRWYESEGLVRNVARTSSKRRQFTADHLRWIALLRALRATSMSVAALRTLAEYRDAGSQDGALELVRTHATRVRLLIGMLLRSLSVLDYVERELTLALKRGERR